MDFVVFSDDWGLHPSSCQHIFRHIARDHRVLWVNTVGMRGLHLSLVDLRKAITKVSAMMIRKPGASTEWTERPPQLHVVQPPMLPMPGSPLANKFNALSMVRAVRSEMARLSMKDPAIVATVPNAAEAIATLKAGKAIYYRVDDFSQWPGLAQDVVRKMEVRLIEVVDLVLAASPALCNGFSRQRIAVDLLPHGVDIGLFEQPLPPAPEWLLRIPAPRIGFFGLLDERLDQDLVEQMATRLPHFSFAFAGPQAVSMPALSRLKNVHFVGNIPYRQLPSFVGGLAALIMPYRVNKFTNTLAPLKLNEYLLSSLPVVSSAIAGTSHCSDLVDVATSPDRWIELLQNLPQVPDASRRERALEILSGSSWSARAEKLLSHVKSLSLPAHG